MTDQPELDLTPPARTPVRSRGRAAMFAGFLVLAAAAAAVAWWQLRPTPEVAVVDPPTPVAEEAATPAPEAVEEPELTPAEVEAAKSLPALGESDGLVRQWAARMTGSSEVARWVAEADLIRRFTAVISILGEGKSPRMLLGALAPEGAFVVREEGERLFIDPASYARYDVVADALATLDISETSSAYRALRPLFVAAWRQIAPPGKSFHQGLDEAIRPLLAVQVPTGEIEVVTKGALYAYADPELESLTAAQKHLVRMGPENAARVQRVLRKVGAALGLPNAR